MDTLKAIASSSKGFFDIVGSKVYPGMVLDPVDLTDKRVLITGANSGIGLEMAIKTAAWGAEVYMICRNKERAEVAREEVMSKTNNFRVYVEIMDCASLVSVREFIRRWGQRSADQRKIDILISNAGVAISSKTYTADGFELTHQVNFLSSYALIVPLLQLGFFASDARIVLVCSAGMYASKKLDPEDLNSEDILGPYKMGETTNFEKLWALSARSKAEQVVFVRELHEKLAASDKWKDISISAAHPGAVRTEIYTRETGLAYNPVMARWSRSMIQTVGISVEQGAICPLFCAVHPDVAVPEARGKYWERCGWKWTPAWMEDADLRKALWRKWEQQARISATI